MLCRNSGAGGRFLGTRLRGLRSAYGQFLKRHGEIERRAIKLLARAPHLSTSRWRKRLGSPAHTNREADTPIGECFQPVDGQLSSARNTDNPTHEFLLELDLSQNHAGEMTQ